MALTRPRAYQVDTTIESIVDPITVLHAGALSANVDVGFLINRANGLLGNTAIYWNESSQSFVTAYTTSSGGADSNIAVTSYANITTGNIYASGFFYANGQAFVPGTTGTNYGNLDVATFLPIYSGNVAATGITTDTTVYGNLTVTGNVVAGNTMIYRGPDQNNWNTLTLMGTYLVNRSSWSGTTGTPLNSLDFVGTLEVLNSGTVIVQNYRPYDTSATPSLFWTRSQFNGSAWTTWTEIIDSAEAVDGGNF